MPGFSKALTAQAVLFGPNMSTAVSSSADLVHFARLLKRYRFSTKPASRRESSLQIPELLDTFASIADYEKYHLAR
jgi:hypothetical protein